MARGEFNSQIQQKAEQEGYLILRKSLGPAMTQWRWLEIE
ncbi:hypothetical protein SAMN04487787_11387 [Kosakonia sacchari]|nr:hypothetical protein SAMN04487787_11387 [Kosakonia sacchari]